MSRISVFLAIFILFAATAAFSQYDSNDYVEIYADADGTHLGRSPDRSSLVLVNLSDFLESETVPAPGTGISTAVMIDASVKQALEKLLDDRDFAIVENSIFTRKTDPAGDIYGFVWDYYGFEVSFMFEKTDSRLESEIDRVYENDAYLSGEVRRSYDDNYSVRIIEAEDVLKPYNGRIGIQEAMLAATVIGSTFQPLLGIRDGLGVLNMLGLATVKYETESIDEYADYRDFTRNGDEIYAFLHTVEGMQGDFIDNLYESFGGISRKHSEDGINLLPEELFSSRYGDNTDFALFYYDILKRSGYQVKLIEIDPGDGSLYATVLFREMDADLWGRIDGNSLDREWAAKWQRIPALIFTASVKYFEPDIDEVFSSGKIELPPPSKWDSSLF